MRIIIGGGEAAPAGRLVCIGGFLGSRRLAAPPETDKDAAGRKNFSMKLLFLIFLAWILVV